LRFHPFPAWVPNACADQAVGDAIGAEAQPSAAADAIGAEAQPSAAEAATGAEAQLSAVGVAPGAGCCEFEVCARAERHEFEAETRAVLAPCDGSFAARASFFGSALPCASPSSFVA